MRYLRHVRGQLSAAGHQAWQDLGRELMPDAVADLQVIAVNANGNVTKCCDSLFILWLERKPWASWEELITGLKNIQLNTLATQIERKLEPPATLGHTSTTTVSQIPKGLIHMYLATYVCIAIYLAHTIQSGV